MVSIIVPIYNVYNFIGDALLSIRNQSYHGFELILVDDCSQDESIEKAEEILSDNWNYEYKIIHHERNLGLSAARNTGINAAQGEWIFFMDGDDLIPQDCLESLVSETVKHPQASMIIGQFDEFGDDQNERQQRHSFQSQTYRGDVIGAYVDGKLPTTAWNKLIRKEFIEGNKLFFEEGLIHEDALWSFESYLQAIEVFITYKVTYHYRQRPGSLDKQNNRELHWKHYNKVYCLQAKYVFDHNARDDKKLFRFIEKNRYQLLTDACITSLAFAESLYRETRNFPYWLQCHRLLPVRLGFILYIRIRCWYLKLKA